MHKLASAPITLDCFEIDDYSPMIPGFAKLTLNQPVDETDCFEENNDWHRDHVGNFVITFIEMLESLRIQYLKTGDKSYWKELVRWLPESWLQKRTVTMSYENLLAMCGKGQRRFHKLNEWSGQDNKSLTNFITWARSLPYAQEFIFIDEDLQKKTLQNLSKVLTTENSSTRMRSVEDILRQLGLTCIEYGPNEELQYKPLGVLLEEVSKKWKAFK